MTPGTMTTTIYHNPRCSKSRQALELVKRHVGEPVVIEYLKTPPSYEQLEELVHLLRISPRELLRSKEEEYAALALDNPELTDSQLIAAMVAHPRLIERPIVIHNGRAIIGRPPEKVLEVLS
jgi:arsenate reductase